MRERAGAARGATRKGVLIGHSFGNAAPRLSAHSIAFETELTRKMGEPVDLDEVSLDVARYATLDMEEALVDLLRKRQEKWQPDLVVQIGSTSGIFVATHRDRLFPPPKPIIYDDMDKRRDEILEMVCSCDTGSGVIILTDMFGGTPSNLAISILGKVRVEVLAGVNLPMLVKLAGVRSKPIYEALRLAQEAGRKHITVASQMLTEQHLRRPDGL